MEVAIKPLSICIGFASRGFNLTVLTLPTCLNSRLVHIHSSMNTLLLLYIHMQDIVNFHAVGLVYMADRGDRMYYLPCAACRYQRPSSLIQFFDDDTDDYYHQQYRRCHYS